MRIFDIFKRKKKVKCYICGKPIDLQKDKYNVFDIGGNVIYVHEECYKRKRKEIFQILEKLFLILRTRRKLQNFK